MALQPSTTKYHFNHISVAQKDKNEVNQTRVIVDGKEDYHVYEAMQGERGWAKIVLKPDKPCKQCGKDSECDIITGTVKFRRNP